jgi:hypothetical protein
VADRNGVVDIVADSCVADYCTVVVVDTVAAGSFAGLRQEQEERADNAAVVVVGAVAIQSVVEAYNTVAGCRGEPEPLVEVVTDGKPIAAAAAAEEQEEVVVVDNVAGQVQEDNLSLDLKQLIGEVSTMPKQTNRWPVIK